jgi:Glycosyl transferases group 1
VRILEGIDGRFVDGPAGPVMQGVVDPGVDVVVLQRPVSSELATAIPHLQRLGVAVVVELDDDFTSVPFANPAFAATHPRVRADRNRAWLARAVKAADLVTVSTPALAARYSARSRVLRNMVPARYLGIRQPGAAWEIRPSVIGWPGSPITHPGDLDVAAWGVRRAIARSSARFRAIGGKETAAVLGIPEDRAEYVPWTTSIHSYPDEVARLDVGIVPLADSAFNRAKSWLKGLELAALGVAFVASPLPEYRALAELGAGVLADSKRTWDQALTRLVAEPEWRREIASRGREVAATLTYERHCSLWLDAWQDAFDHRMHQAIATADRALR